MLKLTIKKTEKTLIYSLVRPIAAFALKIFFRKIYFTNRERIPKGKPLILAINHPSAFIEPCICACFLPMPLHFLVRGDLFKKPFFRKILNLLHMVPIYRMKEDGLDQVKKNDDTFKFCYEALSQKKTVVILPEGKTIQEKRLRPIRKGLARIAFGTYERYGDIDLQIVPIGVNFTAADKFRSVAMFKVGQPIPLSEYYEAHAANPIKAIRELTARLKNDLENQIVNIPNEKDDELTEQLFTIFRNEQKENIFPLVSDNKTPVEAEMKIADGVSALAENEKKDWAEKLKQYFYKLKENGVSDFGTQQHNISNWKSTLFLILGFFPAVIGYAINYPLAGYAKYISDTRVKQLEFKAPVAIAIGLGLSVVFLIVTIIVAIVWKWWAILIFVGVFYLGRYSLIYFEFWEKFKAANQAKNMDRTILKNFQNTRKEFSKKVHQMMDAR